MMKINQKTNLDNRCHKTKISIFYFYVKIFSLEQIVFAQLIIQETNPVFHFKLATQGTSMYIYQDKILQQINGVALGSPVCPTMDDFSSQILKLDFYNKF